jgi:hypothetical protein
VGKNTIRSVDLKTRLKRERRHAYADMEHCAGANWQNVEDRFWNMF